MRNFCGDFYTSVKGARGVSLKKWNVKKADRQAARELAEECGIDAFTALLLTLRGIDDPMLAEEFLSNDYDFSDPFAFTNMQKAVDRIHAAIEAGEKIAVFGDYDCDGVTASTVVYTYLTSVGADVICRLPTRDEGYGMSNTAIDELKQKGVSLIITVDNGITAIDEVDYASKLGMDVVVTDHHIPKEQLPAAVAVVDPKRPDCISEFKGYAGVGVAFMLVCALSSCGCEELLDEYADLVALGTVADVMPALGDNRAFIKRGLSMIRRRRRGAIAALIDAASLGSRAVDSSLISFGLAPRINVAGRMLSPDIAFDLLQCDDEAGAAVAARELNELNLQRQKLESDLIAEAEQQLFADGGAVYDPILVVCGKDWYRGVLGIVAAKLSRKYCRPCICLSSDGETAEGSARGIGGVSVFDLLSACADLLSGFGGHDSAAGLRLKAARLDDFKARINLAAHEKYPLMPFEELSVCCKLNPETLSVDYVRAQNRLEPFGQGNEKPIYGLFGMRIISVTPVGNGNHLRLLIARGVKQFTVMKFFTRAEQFPYQSGDTVDIAVTLEISNFGGRESLSAVAGEVKPSDVDNEKLVSDIRKYENYRVFGESLGVAAPTRDEIAAVYKRIRAAGRMIGEADALLHRLQSNDYIKTRIILDILAEGGLIEISERDVTEISVLPASGKVDLTQTRTYLKLSGEMSS